MHTNETKISYTEIVEALTTRGGWNGKIIYHYKTGGYGITIEAVDGDGNVHKAIFLRSLTQMAYIATDDETTSFKMSFQDVMSLFGKTPEEKQREETK